MWRRIEVSHLTERERLIDLITEANIKLFGSQKSFVEFIADYLLENGVIVLPVKVGESIYYIDEKENKVEQECIRYYTCKMWETTPILTRHNKNFWKTYKFGKNVFLTREEAENALNEQKK